jgi:hypothetical protein
VGNFCGGSLGSLAQPAWIFTNIEPAVDPLTVVFRKPAPDSIGLPSPNCIVCAFNAHWALNADELGGSLAAYPGRSAFILGVKK